MEYVDDGDKLALKLKQKAEFQSVKNHIFLVVLNQKMFIGKLSRRYCLIFKRR